MEQLRVALALGLVVSRAEVDVIHRPEAHKPEDVVTQIAPEALRLVREPDVFVHVEGVYPAPVDVVVFHERGERLVLARSGGEDHVYRLLFREEREYAVVNILRGGFAHRLAAVENSDCESVDFVFFHFISLSDLRIFAYGTASTDSRSFSMLPSTEVESVESVETIASDLAINISETILFPMFTCQTLTPKS